MGIVLLVSSVTGPRRSLMSTLACDALTELPYNSEQDMAFSPPLGRNRMTSVTS